LSIGLLLPLTWYQWRLLERRSYVILGGRGYRPASYDLGIWKVPAFLLCVAVTMLLVVLPISQLILGSLTRFFGIFEAGFTWDHYREVLANAQLRRALWNSAILASIGASVALVLGGLVGYVIARGRSIPRGLRMALNFLSWLPLTVPGIVLALGFLWLYAFSPLPLYATQTGLVVAYVILVLPLVVRAMVGAFSQIAPELEEAGRISGAPWGRTMVAVLLPLVWPSALIAWILAFINIVRDLSTSVLLVPPGQPVFSTALLELWGRGRIEQVCALSVLVMFPMLLARYLVARLQAYEIRMRSTGR
ncbi:MAG TPA: ABC transporter permease subunit, partial [Chloroflexota bacterium]|nr:ABC transporter permease subunit [Chloroflexota bacterium]